VDRFLEFVAGRCQPNTPRAIAFDRQALVAVVGKDPVAVTAADVFDFLADQRGNRTVSCSGPRGHQVPARPLGADFGAPPRPSLHRRGRSDAVSTRRQLEVGEAGVDEYGWWLRRFSAQVTALLLMCRVPVASRKCRQILSGVAFSYLGSLSASSR